MENLAMRAPEPLSSEHDVNSFDCGDTSLNSWLKTRALKNENSGGSRTYVICIENKVIGYYALALGSIEHDRAPSQVKRNMPAPIPVMILGRLGIDKRCQERRLGFFLLQDAILRIYQASKIVGVKAILVHALSERARDFYLQHGFKSSPIDEMLLFLPLNEVETILNKSML